MCISDKTEMHPFVRHISVCNRTDGGGIQD